MNALIDAGAEIEARQIYGLTPLHLATNKHTAETVNALLNRGADIDARSQIGMTPLHNAAQLGPTAETVNTLLNGGDESNTVEGQWQRLAQIMGIRKEGASVADIEARDNEGNTPLHYAAASTKTAETVNALLNGGAYIEARNNDGVTPFLFCAEKKRHHHG